MHPLVLEADEMQDFPQQGWIELIETMKAGSAGAQWRCHGVSRGVRDNYYRMTMNENPDLPFYVHRYMAPHRPTWSDAERKSKIAIYGGTEDNVDYRRNIFGEHGDAHNPLFVLARLMACGIDNVSVVREDAIVSVPVAGIQVGDRVPNAIGTGIVTDVIPTSRSEIMRITVDGDDLHFTPEHPFFTQRGWCHADRLRPGDTLLTIEGLRELWRCADLRQATALLFTQMLGSEHPVAGQDLSDLRYDVQHQSGKDVLRSGVRGAGTAGGQPEAQPMLPALWSRDPGRQGQLPVLRPGVLECQPSAGAGDDDVPAVQQRVHGESSPEVLLAQLLCEVGGGHLWADLGYEQSLEVVRSLRDGVLSTDQRGSGWTGASEGREHRPGSSSGRVVAFPRVDSVALLQPGSAEFHRLSGGADSVTVYDLTVAGHPSYFAGRNPVLVHNCVRINESAWATQYNEDVYSQIKINDEMLRKTKLPIESFIDLPANHLDDQYVSFWAGADIGYTNDPTEILVWGVIKRRGQPDLLRQLARIQLSRIAASDQVSAIRQVFRFYGLRLRRFALDKTGNGLPLWQTLREDKSIGSRIAGYGFSEKKAVEFDDREPVGKETMKDLVIEKNVIDFATDELRRIVDSGTVELPYDVEQLTEFQGQSVHVVKDMGSSGDVRKKYSGGSCHTLDAARMLVAGKTLESIERVLATPTPRTGPVLEQFVF